MKKPKPLKRFWPTTGLAIVSGMRCMTAISAFSSYLVQSPSPLLAGSSLGFLQKKYVSVILKALALVEMAGDKMPDAPDRTDKTGLTARALTGALTGAALYKSRNGNAITGALVGGTVAIAATYGSFYLRKKIDKDLKVSDPTVGSLEDIVALQSAYSIV